MTHRCLTPFILLFCATPALAELELEREEAPRPIDERDEELPAGQPYHLVVFFVVVEPISLIPLFAGLTEGASAGYKRKMAFKACLIALCICVLFAVAGAKFLQIMGISLSSFRLAGGILLFLISLEMVFARTSGSRTTEPDYQNAVKAMDEVIVAFKAVGPDAWKPVMDRLASRKPDLDHDEIKQLLRAAVAIDPTEGGKLLEQVLLGYKLASPKLRWFAAGELIQSDRPKAQQLLRRITVVGPGGLDQRDGARQRRTVAGPDPGCEFRNRGRHARPLRACSPAGRRACPTGRSRRRRSPCRAGRSPRRPPRTARRSRPAESRHRPRS